MAPDLSHPQSERCEASSSECRGDVEDKWVSDPEACHVLLIWEAHGQVTLGAGCCACLLSLKQ